MLNSILNVRLPLAVLLVLVFSAQASAERLGNCNENPHECLTKNEQAFVAAKSILLSTISHCLFENHSIDRLCALEAEENTILQNEEWAWQRGNETCELKFASESEQPGFFLLDGQIRIAKTGSNVGDPVFINRDMIKDGEIDIATAAAVLVHELGHHQNASNHQLLDRLGAKVREMLGKFTARLEIAGSAGNLEFDIINLQRFFGRVFIGKNETHASILLYDGYDWLNLSSIIHGELCRSNPEKPRPGSTWFGSPFIFTPEHPHEFERIIRMHARYICMPAFGIGENRFNDDIVLTLPFEPPSSPSSGSLGPSNESSIKINIFDCTITPDSQCH